jgi:DNA-binding MarR family transcriptional regulator
MSFDDREFSGFHTMSHRLHRLINDVYVMFDVGDRSILLRFDLTPMQYRVLCLLDPEYGQRLTILSDRLICARSTTTRLIDQMEAAGLVHRVDDPEDRRAQRVALTPAGVTLRERAYAAHEASLVERLDRLDEADRQQLAAILVKLRSGLQSYLEEHNA